MVKNPSEPARSLLVVVAAALIGDDDTVLVQQRPPGGSMAGLWEFPGGKLEAGESAEAALVRELHEELAIAVDHDALEPVAFTTGRIGARPLLLLLYACRSWRGEPRPDAATALRWTTTAALDALPMPPADRPLVVALRRFLRASVVAG